MSQPEDPTALPMSSPMADRLVFLPRSLQQFAAGNVSRNTLLMKLLPLSFITLFGTLFIAAQHFPEEYDWRRRVISHLISPRYNPEGYLLPSIGLAVAALLALPVAGYAEQRLHGVAPKLSQWAGVGLGLGIFLMVTVALPFNVPSMPASVHWVHEALARTAAVAIIGGMICCCLCGLKDRFRGGQTLSRLMVAGWTSLTLLPFVCGILAGILKICRKAKMEWAMDLRLQLKQTAVWQLAFWEWVGVVAFILFLLTAAMLLPARIRPGR